MSMMPLSKKRDSERKQVERAKIRLDNLLNAKPVQPKTTRIEGKDYIIPDLDADGNVIPEL